MTTLSSFVTHYSILSRMETPLHAVGVEVSFLSLFTVAVVVVGSSCCLVGCSSLKLS